MVYTEEDVILYNRAINNRILMLLRIGDSRYCGGCGLLGRQTRRTCRNHDGVVDGVVLGVVLGTVFGSAAVVVIPHSFIRVLDIPVVSLLQYLAIASVAGIAAAIIPAGRAARLNVLDAISQG